MLPLFIRLRETYVLLALAELPDREVPGVFASPWCPKRINNKTLCHEMRNVVPKTFFIMGLFHPGKCPTLLPHPTRRLLALRADVAVLCRWRCSSELPRPLLPSLCPGRRVPSPAANRRAKPLLRSCSSISRMPSTADFAIISACCSPAIRPSRRGARDGRQLSNLLPNLSARVQEDVQTQSLTALGF